MWSSSDKFPYTLQMTVGEAGLVIEALATKCAAAQSKANDLSYENDGLREKTIDLESRVKEIERKLGEGK